jgi:hypothetical protein
MVYKFACKDYWKYLKSNIIVKKYNQFNKDHLLTILIWNKISNNIFNIICYRYLFGKKNSVTIPDVI